MALHTLCHYLVDCQGIMTGGMCDWWLRNSEVVATIILEILSSSTIKYIKALSLGKSKLDHKTSISAFRKPVPKLGRCIMSSLLFLQHGDIKSFSSTLCNKNCPFCVF